MKKFVIAALAAIGVMAGFAGTASAAPFAPDNINVRQAQLERRIDQGQRAGRLNFAEVRDLRGQLRTVASLQARYRRGGLNFTERTDLNRRLDRVQFDLQR